jgi:hypothetical protein
LHTGQSADEYCVCPHYSPAVLPACPVWPGFGQGFGGWSVRRDEVGRGEGRNLFFSQTVPSLPPPGRHAQPGLTYLFRVLTKGDFWRLLAVQPHMQINEQYQTQTVLLGEPFLCRNLDCRVIIFACLGNDLVDGFPPL